MRYEIRELNLGGILDQAIALTRNHFGLFMRVASLYLAYILVTGLIQASMEPSVAPSGTFQDDQAAALEAMQQSFLMLPFIVIAGLIIGPITNAAIVYSVAKKYLGEPVTAGESLKQSLSRIFPLIWTWLLLGLAVWGGLILLIIPGIIALIWFSLATQVVVLERVSGFAALGRSRRLVKGNALTILGLWLVIGAVSVGTSIASLFIPQLYVQACVSAAVQTVVWIVSSAAMVVFYFSCRSKHENFDLVHLAQSVGSQPVDAVSQDDEFEEV